MKKFFLIMLLTCLAGIMSVFADSIHRIVLGEEDESVIFFNDSELYFMLPYEKKMMKMDRKLLAYDKDGFLKLTFNGRQALIIDGTNIKQLFTNFRSDGKNNYDRYSSTEDFTSYGTPFYTHNVKSISASSYLKEGKTSYVPENTSHIYNIPENHSQVKRWSNQIKPWVEGKKDDGIGETFEFDMSYPARQYLDIRILNGYVDPLKPHLFKENNRIKKALLETDTGIKKEFEFRDEVEFTQIILPDDVKHVKLTILEVYKGTKYRDTCITSVEVSEKMSEK